MYKSGILCRTIYWSDVGSTPPKIKKASMDGSGVGTVVSLNNVYTFVFTLDYSQQMLYWINSSDNCYYNNMESSSVNGSGRRITFYPGPHNNYFCFFRTQAIDFFGGAIYSYSRYYIDKTEVELHPFNVMRFYYVNNYRCGSSYSGMKVISPKRQLQGIRYK